MVAKSAKPPPSMHIVQLRTQSFSKPIKVNNKTKLRWPHPRPLPEDLALAGFYYFPYEDADDNVCCYLCGKNMGGWEETDDPLTEHLRGNNSCAWAVLRDLLTRSKNGEEFGEDVEDPKSEKMNELREATFGKWWPHDDKKGWNPKSKKMAKAGFYYTPTDDSEDMVNCPYCLIGLDGWEPKDDPLKEHKSRTPTCPFFVGLSGSAPASNVSSPVKSVSAVPIKTQSRRKSSDDLEDDAPPPPKQNKNKRRMTRQTVADADDDNNNYVQDEEIFTNVEVTPPASKRRKSTRVTSQSSQPEEPVLSSPQSSRRISSAPPIEEANKTSRRKSTRASSNPPKARVPSSKVDTLPIEVEEEEEDEKPMTTTRRLTRSAPSPPPEEVPLETTVPIKENTPVKSKGKHTRTKSRNVSALSKIVSQVDKQSRRKSQAPIVEPEPEKSPEPIPEPEPVQEEEEEELVIVPKKQRARQTKARDSNITAAPVKATTPKEPPRRTRQSTVVEIPDQSEDTEAAESSIPEKPAKPLVVPKRKRANTRNTRAVSAVVQGLPEVDETEIDRPNVRTRLSIATAPVVDPKPEPKEPEVDAISEIVEPEPEPGPESELEMEIVAPVPRGRIASRGRGRGRGRGRSSTIKTSVSVAPAISEDVVVPTKPATRRGGGRTSKRDISAVYDDIPEAAFESPSKRKASGLRSIQKIPTPSDDSASEIYEDTKSTFSDMEEVPVPTHQPRRTAKRSSRLPSLRPGSRAQQLTSEERETEDAPSTIYHSADDYLSSPTHSTIVPKSKREMVDNAKKELQEEIWREKVANGEIGIGGSSEDDEKENAAEEKGKKPTRTVRGKGAKGGSRKGKQNGKKKGNGFVAAQVDSFVEEEDESSAGESHALVVKAMISPLRPGPLIAEADFETEASSADEDTNRLTPVRAAPPATRKVLNWTPAKIEEITPSAVTNGELTSEEEEMTVEQWMRWVINDEAKRLQEECEKLVKNLEREGERARRLLENLV